MRWGLLPADNPLMAFVPQIALFLTHLLSGLVVGIVFTVTLRRRSLIGARQAGGR